MTEPKDLLLVIEQLRWSNHRWKALALVACAVVILAVLFGVATAEKQRRLAKAERQAAVAALARASAVLNPGQPR
jgi:uncharacterized membrane protein YqjE